MAGLADTNTIGDIQSAGWVSFDFNHVVGNHCRGDDVLHLAAAANRMVDEHLMAP